MTYRDAWRDFKLNILPGIMKQERGYIDKPMRGEQWSAYVDMLHRDKRITSKQADRWLNPFYR